MRSVWSVTLLASLVRDANAVLTGEYFDQHHRLPNIRVQQSASRQPTPKAKPRRNYTSAPATVHDADSDDSDESSGSQTVNDDSDDSNEASSDSESQTVSAASRSMRGSTLRKRAIVQRSPDLPYVNLESPESANEDKKSAPVVVATPVVQQPVLPPVVSPLSPPLELDSLFLVAASNEYPARSALSESSAAAVDVAEGDRAAGAIQERPLRDYSPWKGIRVGCHRLW